MAHDLVVATVQSEAGVCAWAAHQSRVNVSPACGVIGTGFVPVARVCAGAAVRLTVADTAHITVVLAVVAICPALTFTERLLGTLAVTAGTCVALIVGVTASSKLGAGCLGGASTDAVRISTTLMTVGDALAVFGAHLPQVEAVFRCAAASFAQ